MSDTITIERWETDWETVGEVAINDQDHLEARTKVSRIFRTILQNLFRGDSSEVKSLIPVVWADEQRALIFDQSLSMRNCYLGLGFSPPRILAIASEEGYSDSELILGRGLDIEAIDNWLLDPSAISNMSASALINPEVDVPEAWNEYGRWFANMSRLLETYCDILLGDVRVGIMKESSDLVAFVKVEDKRLLSASSDPHFELGLSLGASESFSEPHIYVRSSYLSAPAELPRLGGGGIWYNGNWFGAVLPASKLVYLATTKDGQVAEVGRFVQSAVRAVESLLFLP